MTDFEDVILQMSGDQDIPIDIAVRKLLEWLTSRRICQKDWHQQVTKIRCPMPLLSPTTKSAS